MEGDTIHPRRAWAVRMAVVENVLALAPWHVAAGPDDEP